MKNLSTLSLQFRLALPGSIRSKKNSKRIYAGRKFTRVLPSEAYLEWERRARESIFLQTGKIRLLKGPVAVNAQIYHKGQRPDLSGCFESIGDCLEGFVYENDKQIISWDGSRLWHDLKNPRTIIEIWSVVE